MADVPDWHLGGDWFDVCNCRVPCPCTFAQAPSMIFSGRAGGWPGEFANTIGEVRGLEYAPISFEIADGLAHWAAEVPGKAWARAEALAGPTTPAGRWDWAGRSSKHFPFDWSGPG